MCLCCTDYSQINYLIVIVTSFKQHFYMLQGCCIYTCNWYRIKNIIAVFCLCWWQHQLFWEKLRLQLQALGTIYYLLSLTLYSEPYCMHGENAATRAQADKWKQIYVFHKQLKGVMFWGHNWHFEYAKSRQFWNPISTLTLFQKKAYWNYWIWISILSYSKVVL